MEIPNKIVFHKGAIIQLNTGNSKLQYVDTLLGNVAHLFTLDHTHSNQYVVKFNNYRNRTKELVNEYIVGKLAELLSLPVLPMQVIFVSEQEIQQLPYKIKKRVHEGNHISFPFINHCHPFSEQIQLLPKEKLVNRHLLAGMIVFDLWVNNTDRSRTNLLFESTQAGYIFYMIDHGRCFHHDYNWTVDTLHQDVQHRINMPIYKWATSLLHHEDELRAFTERIKAIPDEVIHHTCLSIPNDWLINTEEKIHLAHFLIQQKGTLSNHVEQYITRYKDLIWE